MSDESAFTEGQRVRLVACRSAPKRLNGQTGVVTGTDAKRRIGVALMAAGERYVFRFWPDELRRVGASQAADVE
jgi:hypothetical protein